MHLYYQYFNYSKVLTLDFLFKIFSIKFYSSCFKYSLVKRKENVI